MTLGRQTRCASTVPALRWIPSSYVYTDTCFVRIPGYPLNYEIPEKFTWETY